MTKANFQKSYKAIIAFGTPFVGLLIMISTDPSISAALPGMTRWLVLIGIPLATCILTWLKRNEPTVEEAAAILDRAQKRAGTENTNP